MHKTRNDLPEEKRKKVIDLVNARLADAIDLSLQLKQAHWNVKGPTFIALHELFDSVAGSVTEYVDTIAERGVALGGVALGTVAVVHKSSQLDAYPLDLVAGQDHVAAVADALATFGKLARKAIDEADHLGDKDTADVFTEVSRGIDKHLWFVEAHLQGEKQSSDGHAGHRGSNANTRRPSRERMHAGRN